MTSIQLIEIGHIDLVRLEDIKAMGNKSKVFRFDNSISKVNNPTFLNKTELTVYDKELATIQIKTTANFTIGIINRPLEDNFFARPINEKFIVVTTFDFEILELAEGVSIENYVLRFTYAFALIYNAYGGLVEDAHEVMQTNT